MCFCEQLDSKSKWPYVFPLHLSSSNIWLIHITDLIIRFPLTTEFIHLLIVTNLEAIFFFFFFFKQICLQSYDERLELYLSGCLVK